MERRLDPVAMSGPPGDPAWARNTDTSSWQAGRERNPVLGVRRQRHADEPGVFNFPDGIHSWAIGVNNYNR